MLSMKLLSALGLASALAGGSAFAGQLPAPSKGEGPNVLVLKANLDKAGNPVADGAVAIPLKLTLTRNQDGSINFDQLAIDADSQMASSQVLQLGSDQFDQTTLPDTVRQIFANADKTGPSTEHLGWRFWAGLHDAGRAIFGYGYSPYWGFQPGYQWNPYWGYYDNGLVYPYNYGYYRNFNNAGWYYYYY